MTKFPALAVLALLSLTCSAGAQAQTHITSMPESRAARKADKKQQKALKKYAKEQKKAQEKMIKQDKKNTHYPTNHF